jgi:hypothetical protein
MHALTSFLISESITPSALSHTPPKLCRSSVHVHGQALARNDGSTCCVTCVRLSKFPLAFFQSHFPRHARSRARLNARHRPTHGQNHAPRPHLDQLPLHCALTDGTLPWPGGVNDANAVFQHAGTFHLMHQCDGGPAGAAGAFCGGGWEGPNPHPVPGEQTYYHTWGHVVSTDLCHWRRIADTLTPNRTNYEHSADCDGSVSFPPGVGPVLLYGPGCGWRGDAPDLGDAPVVAVAFPSNRSDPLLAEWVRRPDRPVAFAQGSPPCSFAGSVWRHNVSHWSMVCTTGSTRARYTAPSSPGPMAGLEGPWTLADKAFGGGGAIGGKSGPAFLPLPLPQPGGPTHIISAGASE